MARQNGQSRTRRSLVSAIRARMLTPINSAGGTPIIVGQRAVHAQNFVGLVVHDDEVGDGVENLHPVAIGLLDAGEQAGILQRHGGMAGHGFQKDAIFLIQCARIAQKGTAVRRIPHSYPAVAPACNPSSPSSAAQLRRPESRRRNRQRRSGWRPSKSRRRSRSSCSDREFADENLGRSARCCRGQR